MRRFFCRGSAGESCFKGEGDSGTGKRRSITESKIQCHESGNRERTSWRAHRTASDKYGYAIAAGGRKCNQAWSAGKKRKGTVAIRVSRNEDILEIVVMDDGIGMDENQVRQMPRRMRLVKKSDTIMYVSLWMHLSRFIL